MAFIYDFLTENSAYMWYPRIDLFFDILKVQKEEVTMLKNFNDTQSSISSTPIYSTQQTIPYIGNFVYDPVFPLITRKDPHKDSEEMEKEREKIKRILTYFSLMDNLSEANKTVLRQKYESFLVDFIKKLNPNKNEFDFNMYWKIKPLCGNLSSIRPGMSNKIDQAIFPNGLVKGELYTISGISGGGKTAFCSMLTSTLISGNSPYLEDQKDVKACNVIYVSLEQTRMQMECRIISCLSALNDLNKSVSYSSMISGDISNDGRLHTALLIYSLFKERLHVISLEDFEFTPTVDDIKTKIKNIAVSLEGNYVVIIDRYENIAGADDQQNDFVARELKLFAEKEQFPIILQAQLNKASISSAKATDGTLDYRKISANSLRGTSGLEHNSSAVIILIPEESTKDIDGMNFKMLRIVLCKSRYSPNNNIKVWFSGATNLLIDFVETRGRKKED